MGLSSNRWNIVAKNVSGVLVEADAIYGSSMYMNYEKVATQPWVLELLEDVWDAIDDLKEALQAMAKKSYDESVVGGSIKLSNTGGGAGGFTITLDKNGSNDVVLNSTDSFALSMHSHDINLTSTTPGTF